MKTLIFSNDNVGATYYLTRHDADGNVTEKICWCHGEYPEDRRQGAVFASEHEVTDAEYERMAVAIRGGNLTDPDAVVESPITEPTPAEGDETTVTKKKKATK